ncbi:MULTISPECIES: glycosyltransferase [Actinoalloteichus]|uniref:Galactofuranosylgalactofuranosylrhamnosyl-N-acetylglucosaminyl-diphospho-decaprenol beta-1,5/1,6-galactofuranosyltransferase n=1 Tax=Actinoalloteichus caeruleus DSM 43889 TaxID=1120930 RepID=A0ABT1JJW5_ACTCY|nr:glycosyltransferase [Actinoalloteichus caeruleus]MCP2332802.1 galactofuranosylgalactofuranosylrhamnosyl-N-acetylglucosaminyl-diphospho-decaprenol beta-1,5/1,6-galactofuranosyltransferase [Actinoalloteichus caeruleus DSM 43889]
MPPKTAAKKAVEPTQQAAVGTLEQPAPQSGALLQRILFPRLGDPLDVRTLYMDEDETNQHRTRSLSRTSGTIPAQSEVSFATYFNAFPASYWRRWTTLETVELRLRVEGGCRIDVYRSRANGTRIHVWGDVVRDGGEVNQSFDLGPFEDGGWYWFDITTDQNEVVLSQGGWFSPTPAPSRASVSIGITTMRRDDCVATLRTIAEDPLLMDAVTAIVVADQGKDKVREAEAFPEAERALGDKLRLYEQGNLGGSGGFARGMYEALTATDCEQILFMDDDIVLETDSVLRAIAFSRFTEHPTLVGGQMLNLQARSRLHSMGEVMDRAKFMWRPAPGSVEDHDFAEESLRESPVFHRRTDVDYNAWWMCMIPRSVAEEIGLPLPIFIKWDDTEYGLRASHAGYPTATVPGIAVWHMSWGEKDDLTDWQAYFHTRNRLITAALYHPERRATTMIKDMQKRSLRYLLRMEYSAVALQQMAIEDFLRGPDELFDTLPTALGKVRERRAQFDDGRVLPTARTLPLPSMSQVRAERFMRPPTNPLSIGKALVEVLLRNLLPVKPQHRDRPELNLAGRDAQWFLLARLDSATVATADGRGVTFRRRDREYFWRTLRTSVRNNITLLRQFPKLRKQYRKAMPTLTSKDAWKKVFYGG